MKKRVLALLLALVMVVGLLAACGNDNTASSTAPASSTATESSKTEDTKPADNGGEEGGEPAPSGSGPDDTSTHEEFTVYYNYSSWAHPWGEDEYSAFLSEKFNVGMTWSAGENDPDAKLNLMMSSGDLPDMVIMERVTQQKVARAGMLIDLEPLMYDGCSFATDIPESVRNMLKVDGVLYGIPNWARKGATGGNYQWMFNSQILEATGVGAESLNTLQGLHDFAVAAKEGGYTSYNGGSVYPFLTVNTDNGYYVYWPFFRALGGRALVDSYWTQEGAKIEFGVDNPMFVEALKMANTWYNEGLFSQEVFTDSSEQFQEKLTNGRAALLWYDFSQDNTNNFRRITLEKSGGAQDWLVQGFNINEDGPMFPPAEGVDIVYGDEAGGVGWNVNCITTKCTNPQRLFDVVTYMLTPEGSLFMQYGPIGGTMLEDVDWSGELPVPILKKDAADFTSEESNAAGAWFWSQPAQSDYVDGIKFAMNATYPPEKQDWTTAIQGTLCSYGYADKSKYPDGVRPGQKFSTDQLTNVTAVIDSQDALGICQKAIEDQCKAQVPKIIMAGSEDEFNKLVSDLSAYAHGQSVDEINAIWQEKYDDNIATQGFDAYDPAYDVYKLNK